VIQGPGRLQREVQSDFEPARRSRNQHCVVRWCIRIARLFRSGTPLVSAGAVQKVAAHQYRFPSPARSRPRGSNSSTAWFLRPTHAHRSTDPFPHGAALSATAIDGFSADAVTNACLERRNDERMKCCSEPAALVHSRLAWLFFASCGGLKTIPPACRVGVRLDAFAPLPRPLCAFGSTSPLQYALSDGRDIA
jgi:hypothetical protein